MVHNRHNNLSENIAVMFSGNMFLQRTATSHIACIIYSCELHSTREIAVKWENNFTGLLYVQKCMLQLLLESWGYLSNMTSVYKGGTLKAYVSTLPQYNFMSGGRCRLYHVRRSVIQETLKHCWNIFIITTSLNVFCSTGVWYGKTYSRQCTPLLTISMLIFSDNKLILSFIYIC
jgi:hypothetical protein